MGLTESFLLNECRKAISPQIYDSFDDEFFTDILYNKSLVEYSSYFPEWIKNCTITEQFAINRIDPFTGTTNRCSLYQIPNHDPMNTVYIGIDGFRHPLNETMDYMGIGYGGIAEALVYKTMTSYNQTRTKVNASFESPNFIHLDPAPDEHHDFVVDIKTRTKISKIPDGLMWLFKDLFISDVKIDIYNISPNLRENANLGGIEIDSRIGEFSNAIDRKNEILELFSNNYYKEPENFGPQLIFQKKIF